MPLKKLSRPRFGSIPAADAPDLTAQQLQDLQSAILKSSPGIGKYGKVDMKGGYGLLSFVMRSAVNRAVNQLGVDGAKIFAYRNKHMLGVVEESRDAALELWALRSLQRGWITESKAVAWGEQLKQYKQDNRSFEEFLQQLQSDIEPEIVRKFQKMTGLPMDRSREMLGLFGFKYALFKAEQPDYDIWKNTKPLLVNETKELLEDRPEGSPISIALITLSTLYTHMRFLPVKAFDWLLLKYTQSRLNLPLTEESVNNFSIYKWLNRQYIHYNWKGAFVNDPAYDPEKAYQLRKAAEKPFELIPEAGVLAEAEQATHGQRQLALA